MNSHQKPLPSLPSTTPTPSSVTIDKDSSCNDGNPDTNDEIGELWIEGRTHRRQVLEYLGVGPGVIDAVLDDMGRVVLLALTTMENSLLLPSNPGVTEDAALDRSIEENRGGCLASNSTTPTFLFHFRIERRQPESAEDYGFYIVRAATRTRLQNKVTVKFQVGIWDGQILFGKEDSANRARTSNSSAAAGTDQVRDNAETEGPCVGGTFIVMTSNPESDKDIWRNRISCAIYLHLSLLLEQAFLRGCGVQLSFPSSTPIPSLITPPRMTSSPVEMDSGSSRRNSFIPNTIRSWFGSISSGKSLGPLGTKKLWGGSLDLTPTKSLQDAPLPRLKRLLSHRHSHSLSVTEEQPNEHIRHRDRKPSTRQSTMNQRSLLSTSPGLTFPPSSRPAGIDEWVQMQGLTYLEDDKEEHARFYGQRDRRVVEVVRDLLRGKEGSIPHPVTRKWIHAGICVFAKVEVETVYPSSEDRLVVDEEKEDRSQDSEDVEPSLRLSCATCGMKAEKKSLGTAGLLSFSKFLELLIYRPPLPTICSCPALAKIRYTFECQGKEVCFWTQELGGIYTVRVPRVQVLASDASNGGSSFSSKEKGEDDDNLEKIELRREIRAWWESIGTRLDLLEAIEAEHSDDEYEWTRSKALPRVPSEWVHHDDTEFEELVSVDGLPSGMQDQDVKTSGHFSATPSIADDTETKKLIPDLRESFHRTEQALYAELVRTPVGRLNDVRRGFLKGARHALEETEWREKRDKNLFKTLSKGSSRTADDGGANKPGTGKITLDPSWWEQRSHVLAGSNVIVKEDDWGSVIAWCLSSPKYQRELETMSSPGQPTRPPLRPLPSSSYQPPSSFTSKPSAVSPAISVSTSSSTASFFSAVFRGSSLAPEWHLEDHELHVCRKGVGVGLGLVMGVGGMSGRFGSLAGLGKGKIGDEKNGAGKCSRPASQISVGSSSVVVSKQEGVVGPVLPPKDMLEVPTLGNREREGSFFMNALKSVRLLGDAAGIDERPHVRCDLSVKGTSGVVKKWSVTVYYAREFEELRRRCGVMGEYIKSLCRTEGWEAQGGKSHVGFWRTADGRYIMKELVSKWGVADLPVLLSLAPEYVAYINNTSGRESTMVKMLGVYSVEGPGGDRADLVVMENLFYGYASGLKMFDLKGMKGRRSKPVTTSEEDVERKGKENKGKTLFDGEWIDMQREKTILVDPHSKKMLREAIQRDTDFLTRGNIMDYSLLLGVGEGPERLLVVGLVDTIGSYTFAKTIESKAKQNLNLPGREKGEVTVIPPKEYEERFIKAVDRYFVRCPDRSMTPDGKVLGAVL
ncbi:uncharacterized protein BT62DRAFT_1079896 [Guyanagaster necrorhizus]|uniref:PIPK domain-containing protein n=1 Tax=Guyanagaster necrorhizus TaxID=856835 RepID=A0A9P8ANH0_9AGAR|nr:uncharacterized protein BT62DRAFT_1079896 [Guyanagaster necrorhizus MCA 3950]KAG7441741.1 hypothetical protein BT62DRAFT_1079896 [Guyanagaster necrorhizus MCA 3950]